MTVDEQIERITRRLGDDPTLASNLRYYSPGEIITALNQLQRCFVMMTLCLETTGDLILTNAAFYHALATFADWIVPLRVRLSGGGAKLKMSRLADLVALDSAWTSRTGSPTRYSHSGFDLLGIYKHNTDTLTITYAKSPAVVTFGSTMEIPAEYHSAVNDGCIPLLRVKEGQQEWQKALPLWSTFIDAVQECAARVRKRNIELGYDAVPPELKRYDLSKMKRAS